MSIDNLLKNLLQALLSYMEIHLKLELVLRNASVYKSKILWKNLIEYETSESGLYDTALNRSIRHLLLNIYLNS